jgi:hypothetical protein
MKILLLLKHCLLIEKKTLCSYFANKLDKINQDLKDVENKLNVIEKEELAKIANDIEKRITK